MKQAIAAGVLLIVTFAGMAADAPEAAISNGVIHARVYLPDPDNGYYRGTRFDWSGAISSLEYKGHSYFGQWFPRYDPKLHDSITGPVEEFRTGDSALNYAEARPGETFVKIGVGVLRRPDEPRYAFRNPYEILDTGKWSSRKGSDFVEFTQDIGDPKSGYAYTYRKTVRLVSGKPQMVLEHNLKNTGSKVIETNVYNHGFFMLDSQPTGPDITVTFPFEIKGAGEMGGFAEARGNRIVYLKTLEDADGRRQVASSPVEGFTSDPTDFDIRVENRKSGAGVRITGDRPLWRIFFWSVRTTVCPEAYVALKIEPGQEVSWRLTYDFYVLPNEGPPPAGHR